MSQMKQRQEMLRELASEVVPGITPGRRQSRAVEAREAMQRIRRGTYGICVGCGGKIPEERLQAKPEAIRCVKCQIERERRRVA